eukprot:3007124-Karenia_brevis.AAC.1
MHPNSFKTKFAHDRATSDEANDSLCIDATARKIRTTKFEKCKCTIGARNKQNVCDFRRQGHPSNGY